MKRIFCMAILALAPATLVHGNSAALAPSPSEERGAVIQAYTARLKGFRGIFADHTWVAVKPENASAYTIYEVVGWRLRRGLPALHIHKGKPDRFWFGNEPSLLVDVRGDKARDLAAKVDAVARAYPYPDQYRAFPGPNSNTFTAWVAMQVPELGLDLPMRAVGKSYARLAAEE